MQKVLSHSEVEYFLYDISKRFPDHFHAGVICDKDGFVISAWIPRENHHSISENELALLAIADKKKKDKDTRFVEVKKDLDKSKNIKLLLLLKNNKNDKLTNQYKELKRIISLQNLF